MNPFFIEVFGIFSSVLVAVSLTMKNIKWLRIINLAGSLCFAFYGGLIHSVSIVLLNIFTVGVNIFFIGGMARKSGRAELFDILFVDPREDEYAKRFISFYTDDIRKFLPSFNPDPLHGSLSDGECCFILRETIPVSIVAFRRESGKEISILLDYAVPAYRDFKNASYFFNAALSQIAKSGDVFSARAEVPAHVRYLRKIGFEETGVSDGAVLFRKQVPG